MGCCLFVEICPPGIHGAAIIPQRLNGDALKGAVFQIEIDPEQVNVRCAMQLQACMVFPANTCSKPSEPEAH